MIQEGFEGVNSLTQKDKEIISHILLVAKRLAEEKSISESGFRILVNSGSNAGQVVEHFSGLFRVKGNWPDSFIPRRMLVFIFGG